MRKRCWDQGDATKIRLAVPADPADPESFGLWMSAIDDLANETTRATIDFTRRCQCLDLAVCWQRWLALRATSANLILIHDD